MDYLTAIAKAAASSPMTLAASTNNTVRTLRIDGDGIAYYCAGNDEVSIAEARGRARDKIDAFIRASGCLKTEILLTSKGSDKGGRYAVATVKPYQGNRKNSKRPANWYPLRDMLERGEFGPQLNYVDREADDGFGQAGAADPENSVHATQDKDMRMCPGYHLDWKDHRLFYLAPGVYEAVHNDKVYGRKWFWLQMLHGDTADNIPGVPKAYGKLCGEVTAAKLLAPTTCEAEAIYAVAKAYESYWGGAWRVNLLEQAVLLWMRNDAEAKWDNCCVTGNPLACFFPGGVGASFEWVSAHHTVAERINVAKELNALTPQDD